MNDVIEAAIDEDPENRQRTYKKSAIATKIHCFDTLKSSKRKKSNQKTTSYSGETATNVANFKRYCQ